MDLRTTIAAAALATAATAQAGVMTFSRSFGPQAIPELAIVGQVSLPLPVFDSTATLSMADITSFHSPDLVSVGLRPYLRYTGTITSEEAAGRVRLSSAFGFRVEDLGQPILSPPLLDPISGSDVQSVQCGPFVGGVFTCPWSRALDRSFFGDELFVPLADLDAADGMRFVFDASWSLDCGGVGLSCSGRLSGGAWEAGLDIVVTLTDDPPVGLPEPHGLILWATGLAIALAAGHARRRRVAAGA